MIVFHYSWLILAVIILIFGLGYIGLSFQYRESIGRKREAVIGWSTVFVIVMLIFGGIFWW